MMNCYRMLLLVTRVLMSRLLQRTNNVMPFNSFASPPSMYNNLTYIMCACIRVRIWVNASS